MTNKDSLPSKHESCGLHTKKLQEERGKIDDVSMCYYKKAPLLSDGTHFRIYQKHPNPDKADVDINIVREGLRDAKSQDYKDLVKILRELSEDKEKMGHRYLYFKSIVELCDQLEKMPELARFESNSEIKILISKIRSTIHIANPEPEGKVYQFLRRSKTALRSTGMDWLSHQVGSFIECQREKIQSASIVADS